MYIHTYIRVYHIKLINKDGLPKISKKKKIGIFLFSFAQPTVGYVMLLFLFVFIYIFYCVVSFEYHLFLEHKEHTDLL